MAGRLRKKGRKVMDEFSAGTLKSSSGQIVTSRAQAIAIAFSSQEESKKRLPAKN